MSGAPVTTSVRVSAVGVWVRSTCDFVIKLKGSAEWHQLSHSSFHRSQIPSHFPAREQDPVTKVKAAERFSPAADSFFIFPIYDTRHDDSYSNKRQ